MKRSVDPIIERLLRSAASAPAGASVEVPYGFATRVMARLAESQAAGDFAFLMTFLRRGASLSLAVMLVIVGLSMFQMQTDIREELSVPVDSVYLAVAR